MRTHYTYMHLPFYFTHSYVRFSDDPEFARSDIGCFILLIRYSMRPDMLRGAGVSLYPFWYSILPFYSCRFCSFFDSISLPVVIPFLIHILLCVDTYMWYWFIIVDFIACSYYFKLSVYTWSFFLRIYVTDSRRNSVFTYFEKWGVTKRQRQQGSTLFNWEEEGERKEKITF